MKKLLAVIKREYLTRVRSVGFVAATIFTPIVTAGLVLLPGLLLGKGGRTDYRLLVLDLSGQTALFERAQKSLLVNDKRSYRFQIERKEVDEEELDSKLTELNQAVGEERLNAYVVIPHDVLDRGKISFHAKDLSDFIAEVRIANAFNTAVIEQRMGRLGIKADEASQVGRRIEMGVYDEHGKGQDRLKVVIAFCLVGMLSVGVMVYGMQILTAVVEEKQSRIIEVLLSSIEPTPLMLGKLLGVGLVGLTQYAIWALAGLVLGGLALTSLPVVGSLPFPPITVSLMLYFLLYYLLGYFFYATLYVIAGAIVSDENQGQFFQGPLMTMIMLAPISAMVVLRRPDSMIATIISLVPFFSPAAMVFRIAVQNPPPWQIFGSIFFLVASILGAVWLAARFYRVGMLMHGKRPTPSELMRWMRSSG